MKRVLVALIAGTILSGAAAVYSTTSFTVGEARASAQVTAPVR
ncbi:hypothetical protein [Sphingomonas sp. R647]|nr:hypothetical protein [Sphingomonas sp. R647]